MVYSPCCEWAVHTGAECFRKDLWNIQVWKEGDMQLKYSPVDKRVTYEQYHFKLLLLNVEAGSR